MLKRKKREIFIIVNIIVQAIFLGFAIYAFCIGKYAQTATLFCSSMLMLTSSINIVEDKS